MLNHMLNYYVIQYDVLIYAGTARSFLRPIFLLQKQLIRITSFMSYAETRDVKY